MTGCVRGAVWFLSGGRMIRICLPIGSSPGQYFDAKYWFTTTADLLPVPSPSSKVRPLKIGSPITSKYCAVISPEGCAAILWRDIAEAKKAAAAFRLDAGDCLELGVIDAIVPEPAGGAQESPDEAARLLRDALVGALEELGSLPPDERRRRRRRKFREMGVYA